MLAGTHFDPRPDLRQDHVLWDKLLISAQENPAVQGGLHYIRCCGGAVVETLGMYRILQGDMSASEWADAKARILDPLRADLVELFSLWRKKKVPDYIVQFAILNGLTLEKAEDPLYWDCPFLKHV